MTREQVPQMPSRQSESKAIGSSPRAMSSSLTTSSISRNAMSGRRFFASRDSKRPGVVEFFCRQTLRARFIYDLRFTIYDLRARVAVTLHGEGRAVFAEGTTMWRISSPTAIRFLGDKFTIYDIRAGCFCESSGGARCFPRSDNTAEW